MRGVFHVKREAGRRPPAVEVDVAVAWKGEPLLRRRVREGDTAWVGDVEGSWVRIPCGPIGVEGFRLARVKRGEALVNVPRGARGRLERPDGTVELFGSGHDVWLMPGDVIRMRVGSFSMAVTGVAGSSSRAEVLHRDLRALVQRFPGGLVGLSAAFHVALLLVALLWPAREEQAAALEAGPLSEADVAAILDRRIEMGGEVSGPEPVGVETEPVAGPGVSPAQGGTATSPRPAEMLVPVVAPEAGRPEREREREDGREPPRRTGSAVQVSPAADPGSGAIAGTLEGGRAWERARSRSSARAEGARSSEAGSEKGSASWGWMASGALALAGWGAVRWRRSRGRAGTDRPWSWAGAIKLARWVAGGRRVGLLGVGRDEVRAMVELPVGPDGACERRGPLELVELGPDGGPETFDVVGVGDEAASQEGGLRRAWRAVRAGGLLVVCARGGGAERFVAASRTATARAGAVDEAGERAASSDRSAALAEVIERETGAPVVWWFERAGEDRAGLRTVVLAVKGRPSRGPREALAGAAEGGVGVEAAAVAAGFRGWGPFGRSIAGLEAEDGRVLAG